MAHPQVLIDQAQAYADAWYGYFPYPSIFVYGTTNTDPSWPFFGVTSYMDPMSFPFMAGVQEQSLGENGFGLAAYLVRLLLDQACMWQDPSYGTPFELAEPSIPLLTASYAPLNIYQPTAIIRGLGSHILLVP